MFRRLIFTLVLISFALPTLVYSSQQKANEVINFQSIKTLRNSGQLDQAKHDAQVYLQQHPQDADVMLLLGLIHYQQRDFVNAQRLAVMVLNKTPKYEDARILLINCLRVNKNYSAAKQQVEQGLKYNPNSVQLKKLQTEMNNQLQAAPSSHSVSNKKPSDSAIDNGISAKKKIQ